MQIQIIRKIDKTLQETIEQQVREVLSVNREDILVITDIGEVCTYLRKRNYPVVAYIHENNGQDDFSNTNYAVTTLDELDNKYLEDAQKRMLGIPIIILNTKRCFLREMTIDDLDSLYTIYKHPSITKYMEGLFEEREKEAEYIRSYIDNVYAFYGLGIWIIEDRVTRQIIGRAGVELKDDVEGLELGFVIRKEDQNKGYAFEVCVAIIDYVFHYYDFAAIYCYIEEENLASRNLCKKLNFIEEKSIRIENRDYIKYTKYRKDSNIC